MTIMRIAFDDGDPSERTGQLETHLEGLSGIAGTLAAALHAEAGDTYLSQCATELEFAITRLRVLLCEEGVIPKAIDEAGLQMLECRESSTVKH